MKQVIDAIKEGNLDGVRSLLDNDPSLVRSEVDGASLLMYALYFGKRDIALLIAAHKDPLSFHEACALGDLGVVEQQLTVQPGNLNQPSADGFPPLGLAIFFGQAEIAKLLIQRGADVSQPAANPLKVAPVHAAAARGDVEIMRLLLDRGADVNARQQLGFTPLHAAVGEGHVELTRLLIERGADVDARGDDGKTPLDVGRERGKSETVALLEGAHS